jgi:hypothetical protein
LNITSEINGKAITRMDINYQLNTMIGENKSIITKCNAKCDKFLSGFCIYLFEPTSKKLPTPE